MKLSEVAIISVHIATLHFEKTPRQKQQQKLHIVLFSRPQISDNNNVSYFFASNLFWVSFQGKSLEQLAGSLEKYYLPTADWKCKQTDRQKTLPVRSGGSIEKY